jgi:hypothetical protein
MKMGLTAAKVLPYKGHFIISQIWAVLLLFLCVGKVDSKWF